MQHSFIRSTRERAWLGTGEGGCGASKPCVVEQARSNFPSPFAVCFSQRLIGIRHRGAGFYPEPSAPDSTPARQRPVARSARWRGVGLRAVSRLNRGLGPLTYKQARSRRRPLLTRRVALGSWVAAAVAVELSNRARRGCAVICSSPPDSRGSPPFLTATKPGHRRVFPASP